MTVCPIASDHADCDVAARPEALERPEVGWAEKPSTFVEYPAGLFSPAYLTEVSIARGLRYE